MKAPTLKLSLNVISPGVALLLAGILGIVPAYASQTGLHVVPSPFVNNASLNAAGAISANDIWAVGEIANGSSSTQTLAEHFNGTAWSVVATPNLNATLRGVAGAATGDVWAVGHQIVISTLPPANHPIAVIYESQRSRCSTSIATSRGGR
jgi:hypothetical protein